MYVCMYVYCTCFCVLRSHGGCTCSSLHEVHPTERQEAPVYVRERGEGGEGS